MDNGSMAKGDFFNTTGKRIRLLREEAGLTQSEFVEALGRVGVNFSQGSLSNVENGGRVPGGEVIAGAVQVLRTTADFLLLLTDDPNPPTGELESSVAMSEDAEEVARIVDGLDVDLRALVVTVAQAMRQIDRERRSNHQEIANLLLRILDDLPAQSGSRERLIGVVNRMTPAAYHGLK